MYVVGFISLCWMHVAVSWVVKHVGHQKNERQTFFFQLWLNQSWNHNNFFLTNSHRKIDRVQSQSHCFRFSSALRSSSLYLLLSESRILFASAKITQIFCRAHTLVMWACVMELHSPRWKRKQVKLTWNNTYVYSNDMQRMKTFLSFFFQNGDIGRHT